MLSRSNTRRASGSSPALTSSPVRQETFSIPYMAAPIRSASSASRFLSRQTSCMIGSAPTSCRPMDTASGETWACAAGLSVALNASTNGAHRLELALELGVAAAVDHRQLGGDDELAGRQLALKARHPGPSRGDLSVAAAEQVQPR